MGRDIIPLHSMGTEQLAFTRIDVAAAAILSEGQAVNLQAARVEAISKDLQLRRNEMTTLLSDLLGRELLRFFQMDSANANLITAIHKGNRTG